MKLKNKKTGEVVILIDHIFDNYNSLAELSAEWENYEEPKEYWFINSCGIVQMRTEEEQPAVADMHKQFGNHFETKEEAERALEKINAWERLKDKGFRFKGWERDKRFWGDYTIEAQDYITCDDKDLDLLFGGEE